MRNLGINSDLERVQGEKKKIPGTTRGRNPDWNLILFCVKADRGIINHYSITVVYYKVEQY